MKFTLAVFLSLTSMLSTIADGNRTLSIRPEGLDVAFWLRKNNEQDKYTPKYAELIGDSLKRIHARAFFEEFQVFLSQLNKELGAIKSEPEIKEGATPFDPVETDWNDPVHLLHKIELSAAYIRLMHLTKKEERKSNFRFRVVTIVPVVQNREEFTKLHSAPPFFVEISHTEKGQEWRTYFFVYELGRYFEEKDSEWWDAEISFYLVGKEAPEIK